MASKLVWYLQRLKLNKLGKRIKTSKAVAPQLGNVSLKNWNILQSRKLNVRPKMSINYKSNLKYIVNRILPTKIKCPNRLSDFRYLNKGCNGVICTIANDARIIAKQAYKFDPYDNHTVDLRNENAILDKLQRHPNIIDKVNDKEMVSSICQDPTFISSCPDVEHSGLTQTLIFERMSMSLDDLLKTEELTIIDRIDILAQILEAQVYMNFKSICHRDMKLSNILVEWTPQHLYIKTLPRFIVKVADFDCAVDLNCFDPANFSHQGANICTAPEILNYVKDSFTNIKKLYSKNDIWAIGGMAYEIFGLDNPFIKINAQNYSLSDLPPLSSVPTIVAQVIQSLLHPNSSSRYQSCVSTDILQIYRLKLLLTEEVFGLVQGLSNQIVVALCYLNRMYFTGNRLLANPKRMEFVLNYIK